MTCRSDSITHAQLRNRVEQLLEDYLSTPCFPSYLLQEAMHYAVLSGGKRMRPLLVYATGVALNVSLDVLDHSACAIELIHAYSLVHDDLPILDNSDWRRGKVTCHKAFGSSIALLCADALQALAFEVLAETPLSFNQVKKMILTLAKASGAQGMVSGQAMEFTKPQPSSPISLESIYALKTGSLISACLKLAKLASAQESQSESAFNQLGTLIGLAYQIQDDIADPEESNFNYVNSLGLLEAQNRLLKVLTELINCLDNLFSHKPLLFYSVLRTIFPNLPCQDK